MMAIARRMWGSILLGLILGLFGGQVLSGMADVLTEQYDALRPVVKISGERVGADDNAVLIHMVGDKLRDCNYLRVTAFTADGSGRMRDAYINREARRETGETKPRGSFDFGTWRLWPTDGALRAIVYISHQCGGRIVRTKIADVAL